MLLASRAATRPSTATSAIITGEVGHAIQALLVPGPIDGAAAAAFDLRPVSLGQAVTMFLIDHHVSAYWQAVRGVEGRLDVPPGFPATFPDEAVIRVMAIELASSPEPTFALIMTDHFGGAGEQWACVFKGGRRSSPASASINDALRELGVLRARGLDEFDTVGLGEHRARPEHLERYRALCEELGV